MSSARLQLSDVLLEGHGVVCPHPELQLHVGMSIATALYNTLALEGGGGRENPDEACVPFFPFLPLNTFSAVVCPPPRAATTCLETPP